MGVFTIIALALVFGTSFNKPEDAPHHCKQHSGVIVALLFSGLKASRTIFYPSASELGRMNALKQVMYKLYISLNTAGTSIRSRDEAVIIDEVSDIAGEDVFGRRWQEGGVSGRRSDFTMRIVLRIVFKDMTEATRAVPLAESWVKDQTILRELAKLGRCCNTCSRYELGD